MQLMQIGPCRLAVEVSGAAMMGTLVLEDVKESGML
jgi:hypothetical protein